MKTTKPQEYDSSRNHDQNEIEPLKVTRTKSDDPLKRLYQMSQEQKVYKTRDRTIKNRDIFYFARLGKQLADEAAEELRKERNEKYGNKN